MREKAESVRIPESTLDDFERTVLEKLGVPQETARLAVRSLLDASLMGINTHGIEALDMYVDHITKGGLDSEPEPVLLNERVGLGLWDMQNGFGLAGARKIMTHAITCGRKQGIYMATCRRTNHIGACGVYGKMAADNGLIGMVGQQTGATFSPCGGRERRVGASPTAFVAPVKDSFPFYYDGSFAQITGAQMKAHRRAGMPLPPGVALDKDGNPTTDPQKAWGGQIMPIGQYKGVGLAMVFEILHCILSGNVFSCEIPSIVSNPHKTAESSIFMIVIDPGAVMPHEKFAEKMKCYVEYIESSPARDPNDPPRYPGRREGENWHYRRKNGIPVRRETLERFDKIACSLGIKHILE